MSQTTCNYSHERNSFISGVTNRFNKDDRRGDSDTVQTGIPTTTVPLCDFENSILVARGIINWPEDSLAFIEPEGSLDYSEQPAGHPTVPLFPFFWATIAQLGRTTTSFFRLLDYTQLDTHPVGLLWTSDQHVAEAADNTTNTTDEHPSHQWDSNPRPQQTNGRRPTTYTVRPAGSQ